MKRIFIFPTIEEAKAFILTEPRDPVFVGGVGMAEIAAATLRAVKAKKPQLVVLAGIAGACDRTLRRGEVVEVVCERIAGIPERYAREYETSGPDLGLPLAAGVTVNRSGDGAAATGGPKSAAEGTGHAAGDAGFAEPHPGFTAGGGAEHAAEGTQRQTPGNARNQPGNMAAPIGFETPDDTERTALGTQPGIPDNAGNLPQKPEGSPEDTPQEYLPEVENMEGAAFFAVCDALGVACCQIRAVSNYVGEPFDRWAGGLAVENLTATLTQIFGNDE